MPHRVFKQRLQKKGWHHRSRNAGLDVVVNGHAIA
jgi:hypothetical protein